MIAQYLCAYWQHFGGIYLFLAGEPSLPDLGSANQILNQTVTIQYKYMQLIIL